jgi:proline iminopeptidase
MDLFPPIEPFATGMLPVGDGHALYWEQSGQPEGVAVLFLHGGPGAGCAAAFRRFFDPTVWRIVLHDQRGAGRSVPAASITANTTADLVADIERLRAHLGIESWMVFGGSWGSTLALAYGQAHPERCLGFVLRGIFLFHPEEVAWFLHGMGRFFPEAEARFLGHLPPAERGDPLAAYIRRLNHPDPQVHLPAARIWCGYEDACARLVPAPGVFEVDAPGMLAMARIEAHYMRHGGFLAPGQLLAGMAAIRHIPAHLVQGRYDVVCPPSSAAALAAHWPAASLQILPDCGHSAMEPPLRAALVAAVERMKPLARAARATKASLVMSPVPVT